MLSGWLTRGSEGCDVSVRGLFKLIVGVRWMIGAILSCDPNKWWRCKVSLNICSLYLLCSIWGAVIASSLIRGCKTFLACHGQSRADTPAVYYTGLTGPAYARFASPFLIIILNAYHHHDDIYAESDCKYSEFYYLLDVTGLFWSISMFGILTLHIILLLCSRDIFSTTTTISKVSRADPSIIKINECHMRSWKYLRDATDNHNMIPAKMSLQTKYRVLRQFELICCHYPGPQPSSHFEISSQQSDIFPPENLLRPRNATSAAPIWSLG